MQTLRMLGEIALASEDGRQIDALLRQPKSVALLAYLALPRPGTWHRRDVLLALFYGELSQSSGRAALRSALSVLRRHLADGTIRTRGDDDVCVDPALLATDAGAVLDAFDAGDHQRAIDAFRGDLLPALYIPDAPEFERWVDAERARLRTIAMRAASALVDERESAGDVAGAVHAARHAAELSPDDESAARRWIATLDRAGDRAQALAVFERLRLRLASEFGTDPSPETLALVERVRTRTSPATLTRSPFAVAGQATDPPPDAIVTETASSASPTGAASSATTITRARARAPRRAIVAFALFAVALAIGAFGIARQPRRAAPLAAARAAAMVRHRLVLLPVESERRDPGTDSLAFGIAYGITRRLERFGTIAVRLGSADAAATPSEVDPVSPFGMAVLLRVGIATAGDSLAVRASLVDSASGRGRDVLARRVPRAELSEVESEVAAAVAGALYRAGVPFAHRPDGHVVDPDAYRLTILGYDQLIRSYDDASALRSFLRATERDPLYARAWAGVASVWGYRTATNLVPEDDGYERAAAAAARALALDSTQGSALAGLGVATAVKYRSFEAGMSLLRRAMAYEPSNPEVFIIASFLNRLAHRWDDARDLVRVARQLDPLTLRYPTNEAAVELCAGRPVAGERVAREELEQEPGSPQARSMLVRALALQHRYDEALELWRAGAGSTSTAAARELATARGRGGYFAVVHADGRARLDDYRRTAGANPLADRLMELLFLAGDSAAGFAALDSAVKAHVTWTYRLPCFPLDEIRDTPRYARLLRAAGALPLR
jgi:DNA-binding SARP family transcriptional activator